MDPGSRRGEGGASFWRERYQIEYVNRTPAIRTRVLAPIVGLEMDQLYGTSPPPNLLFLGLQYECLLKTLCSNICRLLCQ